MSKTRTNSCTIHTDLRGTLSPHFLTHLKISKHSIVMSDFWWDTRTRLLTVLPFTVHDPASSRTCNPRYCLPLAWVSLFLFHTPAALLWAFALMEFGRSGSGRTVKVDGESYLVPPCVCLITSGEGGNAPMRVCLDILLCRDPARFFFFSPPLIGGCCIAHKSLPLWVIRDSCPMVFINVTCWRNKDGCVPV